MTVPASVAPGRYDCTRLPVPSKHRCTMPILVSDLEEKARHAGSFARQSAARHRAGRRERLVRSQARGEFFQLRRACRRAPGLRRGFHETGVPRRSRAGHLHRRTASCSPRPTTGCSRTARMPPNLDPYLVYTFEKAGRYIAMIRDSAERGNPNYVYRLAIYPGEPDFDLKGLSAERDAVPRQDRPSARARAPVWRLDHADRSLGGRSGSGRDQRTPDRRAERHHRQGQLRARPQAGWHQCARCLCTPRPTRRRDFA